MSEINANGDVYLETPITGNDTVTFSALTAGRLSEAYYLSNGVVTFGTLTITTPAGIVNPILLPDSAGADESHFGAIAASDEAAYLAKGDIITAVFSGFTGSIRLNLRLSR